MDRGLRLKAARHVRFAGQITGVESAAIGLLAGRFAAAAAGVASSMAWVPPQQGFGTYATS